MNVDELLSLKAEKRVDKGSAWIIHSVSKTYCFASACDITITRVTWKKFKTLILWQFVWHLIFIFQLYPFDVRKLKHSCKYEVHKLQWESLHSRAVDTGGARGAMAPPLSCKIILFVFSAKHSFSSSRVWILYINNWIHRILNDNKVIS